VQLGSAVLSIGRLQAKRQKVIDIKDMRIRKNNPQSKSLYRC